MRPKSFHHWREHLIVGAIYVLIALGMTWPLVARLGTHMAGGGDMWAHQWTFWWMKRAILKGINPLHTDMLFYPQGVSLIFHNIAWLNIALWLPLQAVFGRVIAYNLIFIAIFALNGFAMYLLARDILGSKPAAFVGGVIYGFWPHTLSHYEHPNLIFTCWVPLALLYLRRTLEEKRTRDALWTSFFLFLTGVTRWHLLIMGGVIIGLYLFYKWASDRGCRNWPTLKLILLSGLIAALLLAPLASPLIIAQLTRTHPEDIFIDEQFQAQTDLLAYVTPSRFHPLWGDAEALDALYQNFNVNYHYIAFLGYIPLALALYGAARDWRRARFWVCAALVYFLLALGPELRINGQLYPWVPMPYRLVGDLFLVRVLRKPDRFNIFLGLPLGMLASLGVQALAGGRVQSPAPTVVARARRASGGYSGRVQSPAPTVVARARRASGGYRVPPLLAGVLSLLIICEYCPLPYPTRDPFTPNWYKQLAHDPADFAVLDLPLHGQTFDKRYMFYQTTHDKPLVGGKVARIPREALAFIKGIPFLEDAYRQGIPNPKLKDISHQLGLLAEAGGEGASPARYIVLHKRFANAEQMAAWRDWLTFQPRYEDAEVAVYSTTPELGRDFEFAHHMTDAIGVIRASFAPTETTQAGLIEVDVRWGSSLSQELGEGQGEGEEPDICLHLSDADGRTVQSHCEALSSAWPPSSWGANEIVRGLYAMQIDPFLEPGLYTPTLTLSDAGSSFALEPLSVNGLPRIFDPSTRPIRCNCAWRMRLCFAAMTLTRHRIA